MTLPSYSAEPLAYLNGQFLPQREARLPIWDLGIIQAVTVTEAVRTFRHQPFRLEQHLARLKASTSAVGIEPVESLQQLREHVLQLIGFNSRLIPVTGDLAAILFATAGESRLHSGGLARRIGLPTMCIYTYPLVLKMADRWYERGLSLAVPRIRHIPPGIIDPRIKYRSRLHWHLAEREVQRIDPDAEALLLDQNGFVTETAKGNLFALFGDTLQTPEADTTLEGVSQDVVRGLAEQLGLNCQRADLTPSDLLAADELWISSTTTCVVPVTHLNGQPIGDGRPGPVWQRVIRAWSDSIGMDIRGQAALAQEEVQPC